MMGGLNKINRRQFLSRLLKLGAAVTLTWMILERSKVLEPLVPVVVPHLLADEEPDEAEAPDIAWWVKGSTVTQQQINEFEALQASRRAARRVYLKKVIALWDVEGRVTPWEQWHEAHFKKIYARTRVHAGYRARDDLRVAMGLAPLLS